MRLKAFKSTLAKSIKCIDGFAVHIFSRKHSGQHDNKYVKVIKNGTVFAKYRLDIKNWEALKKDVTQNVINWITQNEAFILQEINNLDM